MIKKILYIAGILALGFVIFNNIIQTVEVIRTNTNYIIGLVSSLIGALIYGIVNVNN